MGHLPGTWRPCSVSLHEHIFAVSPTDSVVDCYSREMAEDQEHRLTSSSFSSTVSRNRSGRNGFIPSKFSTLKIFSDWDENNYVTKGTPAWTVGHLWIGSPQAGSLVQEECDRGESGGRSLLPLHIPGAANTWTPQQLRFYHCLHGALSVPRSLPCLPDPAVTWPPVMG